MHIKEEPSGQMHFFQVGDYRLQKIGPDPHMCSPEDCIGRPGPTFSMFNPQGYY